MTLGGEIRVVAALVRRGGSVLVQQRRPGSARGLLWEFPGGKVEPGESDARALERECREELAVDLEVVEALDEVAHSYQDLSVVVALYRCRILAGEPQALHAQQVRFEPIEGLAALPFCEADGPFVEALGRGDY